MHDVDFKIQCEEEIDGLESHAPGLDRLRSHLMHPVFSEVDHKALWFVESRQIDDRHFYLSPERGRLGGVRDSRRLDIPSVCIHQYPSNIAISL